MKKKADNPTGGCGLSPTGSRQEDISRSLPTGKREAERLFVLSHRLSSVSTLALQARRYPDLDFPFVLDQIAGWQTARTKLPSWAEKDGIVYPPHLSMEQCSSEQTARYKAELASRLANGPSSASATQHPLSGREPKRFSRTLIDLTGGFGVDFSFMARHFSQAVYVEKQERLCGVARHNFGILGLAQAEVVCGDGAEYLHTAEAADVIYLDPARRNRQGGKTVLISDCTPDVLALEDELLAKSRHVVIKLSPMLDWHRAVEELNRHCGNVVREVHIVSIRNECKELLLVLEGNAAKLQTGNSVTGNKLPRRESAPAEAHLHVFCVNDDTVFDYLSNESTSSQHILGTPVGPDLHLYEPNASLMKAGCFGELTARFPLRAVAPNSHLFVSDDKIEDFPGRSFVVSAVSSMNKKELKRTLQGIVRANIAVRNFPLSVAELRKRLKLQEGGDCYIFATTTGDGIHRLLITRKSE
ncbi:class I SAM-dependent methyltransferase [Prevotella dentasini]|uniref:class I SAM-dependent methyltransferase n=1 Tax=Prevotella dentasini TaxID=589537 RepID=UPI000469196F|nr:class I SAM-dependent methyltransferase [Prevotella dentasini]